jgi:hypothetical protein
MKTTFNTTNLGLLLHEDGNVIGVLLIETGEGKDISENIKQVVSEHYCVEKAVINNEIPTGHIGYLPINNDYTITEEDSRTMVFSVDLFEGDEDDEPSEVYDIKVDVITVYSNSPYTFKQ